MDWARILVPRKNSCSLRQQDIENKNIANVIGASTNQKASHLVLPNHVYN